MLTVTIATPWLNHLDLAADYWRAVNDTDAEVLVIDNGSDPPLPNAVRLPVNRGFHHACNLGLRMARTDAVLFLNNDVVLTRSGWLDAIRAELEPGVLVGAAVRYDRHGDVDGVSLPYLDGWCLAGMRDDLVALGGFDEGYQEPSYYGDNDLSLRARAAGMVLREVRVGLRHLESRTSRPDLNAFVGAVTASNRDRFAQRARDIMADA